jgi:ParB family transcriptional regulator, chromosome partitioning protein
MKKRGLNRGLDALLSLHEKRVPPEKSISAAAEKGPFQSLPIELLKRGKYQPRKDMHPESLEDLAQSIRVQGIIQPIIVRKIGEQQYEIIAGERRWRAAQLVA